MQVRALAATAAIALAVVVFATMLTQTLVYAPQGVETSPAPSQARAADEPALLHVPALGIRAAVENVGIAPSGNMAVPRSYANVGWYRGGTVPGAVGSAVMDGHVDNGLGAPAVFSRLGELKKGDEIFVDSASGTLRFVVEEVESYPLTEVPRERVFNRADRARLNLITCEGEWLATQKTYDRRIVVYAVLV